MEHFFVEIMEVAALVIGGIGALVICWGVAVGVLQLIRIELTHLRGGDAERQQGNLRQRLGYYLLLGLEFLLAADIVETIIAPSLEHLGILAAIVVLRTIISWSLSWELARERHEPPDPPP